MEVLTAREIDCLRRIANGPSARCPPCPERTLERLLELGLIECSPGLWAPLEGIDTRYRLTPLGELHLRAKKS